MPALKRIVFPQGGPLGPTIISTSPLPQATVGTPYSFTFQAVGRNLPFTWAITSGVLPGGLSLASNGTISGTPTTATTANFSVQVTDNLGLTAPGSFSFTVAGSGGGPQPLPPSLMWPGNVSPVQVAFGWWPPTTCPDLTTYPDTYNVYRDDFSLTQAYGTGFAIGGAGANNVAVDQVVVNDNPVALTHIPTPKAILPSTSYTYRVKGVKNGIESAVSTAITMTTLAAGPGATFPQAVTDPATYIPPLQTTYSNFFTNPTTGLPTNTSPITTAADLATACANAQPGQVVVVQAGTTFANSVGGSAFTMSCLGTAGNYITFTTTEDQVLKQGGKLPNYSYRINNGYTPFTLATPFPAATTRSATLLRAWTGRTGYYPVVFYTNGRAFFESRTCHFINGQTRVTWEAGFWNTGPLQGAVTAATILVDVGNYAGPDDIAAMPTLQYGFLTNSPGLGLTISGSFIRVIGFNIAPQPNAPPSNVCNGGVTISGNNVMIDRCVIGNNLDLASWSPVLHSVNASGNNIVCHQTWLADNGFGFPVNLSHSTGDTQGWISAAGGPHCVQNCYVAAIAESIIAGGVYVGQTNIAHDITFRDNYSHKNGSWSYAHMGAFIKNHFELKGAIRVEAYRNTLENCWLSQEPGQNGRGFTMGTIDQASTQATRTINDGSLSWSALNGGTVSGVGLFLSPAAQGVTFLATIAGVTPAGYNGTFLCTYGTGGSFTYQLAVNPGANGTRAVSTVPMTITNSTIFLNPWLVVTDVNVHDNGIYGCAQAFYMHKDDGHQLTARNFRVNFSNNFGYINCAGWGQTSTQVTATAVPTATGFTIAPSGVVDGHGNIYSTWPFNSIPGTGTPPANPGNAVIHNSDGTTQVIPITSLGNNGTTVTWASTTINPLATTSVTVTFGSILSLATNMNLSTVLPDVTLRNNTFVTIPNKTGFLQANANSQTLGINEFTLGTQAAPFQMYRLVIENNIIDGTVGFNAVATSSGYGGVGPTALNQTATNPIWDRNVLITDGTTGWPNTVNPHTGVASVTFNDTYANIFDSRFPGNTVFPQAPWLYNAVQTKYLTNSTTGGPVGSLFTTPLQFPLLGAYLIGGIFDPGGVAHIADMDTIIIGGYQGQGAQFPTFVANAKAANPNMAVFAYVKINSQVPTSTGFAGEVTQMGAASWWVYDNFNTKANIGKEFNGSENAINIIQNRTSTNAPFPGGPTSAQTVRQWLAQYATHYFGTGAAPALDGMFTDNFYFQPRAITGGSSQADWNETGTAVSDSSVQVAWRAAMVDWDTQLRAVMGPNYLHIGNSADWGSASGQVFPGLLNGAVIESQQQDESQQGWTVMMAFYKATMISMVPQNGRGPYPIFSWAGASATNFAAARYALCSCLLDNGYFFWNVNEAYNTIVWFDELAVNMGAPIAGPNNPNNGTYSSGGLTVWSNGVWRRDFQNVIALVNPRGNGAKSVTLEVDVWRLRGTQDPVTNSAAKIPAGTAFTMADAATAGVGGSGLILSRVPT